MIRLKPFLVGLISIVAVQQAYAIDPPQENRNRLTNQAF